MYAPTLHLGGTSFTDLYEQHTKSIEAVRCAIEELTNACPHPRDYIRLDGGYQTAIAGHLLRMAMLKKTLHQLEELRENICKQNDLRVSMRRRNESPSQHHA